MNPTESLVVVAGLSGAGRTTALGTLEDLGYYCVDNVPPAAFSACLAACAADGLPRIAIGIDVRIKAFVDATLSALDRLAQQRGGGFTTVFLDASDASLLTRYSTTRRPHPLSQQPEFAGTSLALVDGIAIERERLTPLRARADVLIDTSHLNVHELRRRLVELFRPTQGEFRGMVTRFVSFGFKYGAPSDLDLLFDVRFVENPHFDPVLRPQSGLDEPVSSFVNSRPAAASFATQVEGLLAFLIPEYQREGKSYLTVGFGCTGGRHRSVALAEELARRLGERGHAVTVGHRDLARDTESREPKAAGSTR